MAQTVASGDQPRHQLAEELTLSGPVDGPLQGLWGDAHGGEYCAEQDSELPDGT